MTARRDFLPGRASAAELNAYVELLENSLTRSRLHGDPGNWFEPERALRQIAARVTDATRVRVPEWAYQLELELWIEYLHDEVLPDVLARLVDEIDGMRLRGRGWQTPDPGLWASLASKGVSDKSLRRNRIAAEATLLGAYRQHLEQASAARMRDAIAAMRALCEQSLTSFRNQVVSVLARESDYLAHALGEVLPPTARLLLATAVQMDFEEAVESIPVRQLPESRATDWFRRYPGLDGWYPVWDVVEEQAQKEACEDSAPKLFVPGFQQLYLEFLDERERDIKGQERT